MFEFLNRDNLGNVQIIKTSPKTFLKKNTRSNVYTLLDKYILSLKTDFIYYLIIMVFYQD